MIEKIGKFKSDFFAFYEEVDYCVLAKLNGFSVRYLPVETVYHKDSVSARKITGLHIYLMFRNRIIFLKDHSSAFQYIFSFLYLAAYLPYFTLKYGFTESSFLIKGTADGLLGKKGNPFDYRKF